MPKRTHNEVVAGIFVVLTLGLIVGIVLWLGAANLFAVKGQLASFYVPAAQGSGGLEVGSNVTYGGGVIGQVVGIEVQPGKDRCLYRAQLNRKDLTIHADGSGQMVSALTGMSKLTVSSIGTPSAGPADDEHPIKISGGLDQAMADIATAAENVKAVSKLIRDQLDPATGGKLMSMVLSVMDDLKSASGNVAAIAVNVRGQTELKDPNSMLAHLHQSAEDISAITTDARPKMRQVTSAAVDMAERLDQYTKKDVADILAQLRSANTDILKVAKDLADISGQAKDLVTMNRDNIDVMISNMTSVSANLKAMAQEVQRHPWRLLYRPTDKESRQLDIYEAARSFAEGASQLDITVAKLTGLAKANPQGVPANNPELKKLTEQLKETFSKFSRYEQALWNELQKN